jgi:hypothetical protein
MASSAMRRRFARKSRQELNGAAGYNSGGRTKRKTSSGSSRTFGSLGIAEQQSSDHERNWIGDSQLARDQRQHGDGKQQPHKDFSNARQVSRSYSWKPRVQSEGLLAHSVNSLLGSR